MLSFDRSFSIFENLMMSIYKDCDIRGRYGDQLFDSHADKLGRAIIHLKGAIDILIGGDGRLSTGRLKKQLIETLSTGGCRVIDVGQVPTPAFYFARRFLGVETGIMVTASHNPAADNGFKIVLGQFPITIEEMRELSNLMQRDQIHFTGGQGSIRSINILPQYQAELHSLSPDLVGLNVVVDCANGMASLVARSTWGATGAQVEMLFDIVDGKFPNHAPNPARAENLIELQKTVIEKSADLGVAYDGDADRVAFVDNLGRPVLNDKVIVAFSRHILEDQPAAIVYDQKCSKIVPETINALGGEAIMERSGHTFIKTTFLRRAAAYAGEVSGHHFFKTIAGDDGVYASLYMAETLARRQQSFASIVDNIPAYPITPDIRLPMARRRVDRILTDLNKNLTGYTSRYMLDGLRVGFPEGWGLARPSVTEEAITLRFEGVDKQGLVQIMQRFELAARDLQGCLPIENYVGE